MAHVSKGSRVSKAAFSLGAAGCVAVIALLAAGCSGHRSAARRDAGFARVVSPRPPAFLTGPASVLFTNWVGFSAHVDVEAQSSLDMGRSYSGLLLGRGTKLLYAPATDESA